MRLIPQGDRVLVQRFEPESKSAGGIIIPDQAQDKNETVLIQSVYPDWTDHDGKLHHCRFEPGSLATVSKYSGEERVLDGGRMKISLVRESDILALIELDEADGHVPGSAAERPRIVAQMGADGVGVQSYESLAEFNGPHPVLAEAHADGNGHAAAEREPEPSPIPQEPSQRYAYFAAAKEAILKRLR
jgi:chaperonin GroES